MAYSKQTWTNDVTAITAERMTHIENGIYDNSLATDKINPSGTATIPAEIEEGQITDVIGFKSLKLKGQTSQGENPTPDNPQEVESVSGDNVIEISNKNLIEYSFKGYNINSQGKFETGGTSLDFDVNIAKVKAGTTYTITPATNIIAYFDERPTITSQAYNNSREVITSTNRLTPTRSGYIAMRTATSNTAQLEKGTSATSFVAHQGNDFEINLGAIELCKIGTYQDYIYKKDGKWWKHKEIGEVILDDTLTYSYSTYFGAIIWTNNSIANVSDNTQAGAISDKALGISPYTLLSNNGIAQNNSNNRILIKFDGVSSYNTDALAKQYFGSNNYKVYYILATPIDEEITYAPLLRQLDEVYNSGLYDVTNISQDNSSEAFILDIEACKNNINGIVEYIRR